MLQRIIIPLLCLMAVAAPASAQDVSAQDTTGTDGASALPTVAAHPAASHSPLYWFRRNNMFCHLSAGIGIGLDGISIELGTPMTDYAALRAGLSFFPAITLSFDDVSYSRNGRNGQGQVDAKFKKVDGKVLVDAYPFGLSSSFHVTAGLFFGTADIVTADFTQDPDVPIRGGFVPTSHNPNRYVVEPDENGVIKAKLSVNSVKPYIGLGFGRMVPKGNNRLAVACDLGVQLHGTPTVRAYAPEVDRWLRIEADDLGNDFGESFKEDFDDGMDIIKKVTVWPVLNIRLTGRIF